MGEPKIETQSNVARALQTELGQAKSADAKLNQQSLVKASYAEPKPENNLARSLGSHPTHEIAKVAETAIKSNSPTKLADELGLLQAIMATRDYSQADEIRSLISARVDKLTILQDKLAKAEKIRLTAQTNESRDEQHRMVVQKVDKAITALYTNKYADKPLLKVATNSGHQSSEIGEPTGATPIVTISYVHDRKERKDLLDGTGEGFPTPSSHELSDLPANPGSPEWTEKVDHSHLQEGEWHKLHELIILNEASFAKHKGDIGCSNLFSMSLPLKPGTGYLYSKPRPTPAKHKEIITEHITELLEQGIIRPSKSPFATNIVIVKKKSGVGEPPKTRMCVK